MNHGSTSRQRDCGVGAKSGAAGCSRPWLLLGFVLLVAGSLCAETTNIIRRQVLLPDGRPAVGAKIHGVLHSRDDRRREIRTVTDAAGKFASDFELKDYDEGCLTIDATNCALLVMQIFGRSWMLSTNQEEKSAIQLKAAYSVSGQVVDAENRGVAGAQVVTAGLHPHTYLPLWLREVNAEAWPELGAVSGKDGHFKLRGIEYEGINRTPTLQVSLAVFTAGTDRKLSGEVVFTHQLVKERGAVTNPVVVLHPTVSITGRASNPITRRPVEGANVSVSGTSAFRFPPVVTGAGGRFTFREFPSYARLQFSVTHSNYASAHVFRPKAKRGDSQVAVDNLEIRLRPFVTVSGKIVDAESGGPMIVPVELTVKKEEALTQGFVQTIHHSLSSGQGNAPSNGVFSVQIPAGPVAFHVASSSSTGAYRKPYDHESVITVPPDGQTELLLKIPRKPGVLVQLESSEPWKMQRVGYGGDLIINVREEKSNGYGYADYTPLWFFPVEEWGRKMEVNMVRRINRSNGTSDDIEIFPWTGIVADPKTWPVRLKVP